MKIVVFDDVDYTDVGTECCRAAPAATRSSATGKSHSTILRCCCLKTVACDPGYALTIGSAKLVLPAAALEKGAVDCPALLNVDVSRLRRALN